MVADRSRTVLLMGGCALPGDFFNGNNFATSAALAEVCALPSAVLFF